MINVCPWPFQLHLHLHFCHLHCCPHQLFHRPHPQSPLFFPSCFWCDKVITMWKTTTLGHIISRFIENYSFSLLLSSFNRQIFWNIITLLLISLLLLNNIIIDNLWEWWLLFLFRINFLNQFNMIFIILSLIRVINFNVNIDISPIFFTNNNIAINNIFNERTWLPDRIYLIVINACWFEI